jgi:hypothetical protein
MSTESWPPPGPMPPPWPVFTLGAAWVADLVFKRHAEELERYLRVLARDSRPEYRRAGEEFAMAARGSGGGGRLGGGACSVCGTGGTAPGGTSRRLGE